MDCFNIILVNVTSLFASVNNVFASSQGVGQYLLNGTVINDVTNSDNLNIIIIGMVVFSIGMILAFSKKIKNRLEKAPCSEF